MLVNSGKDDIGNMLGDSWDRIFAEFAFGDKQFDDATCNPIVGTLTNHAENQKVPVDG